jgi:hypothetical protein
VPKSEPLPEGESRGNRGNSGVYLQRRYEVQILDSFGHDAEPFDCGALYEYRPPRVSAARPAGRWQTLDITFRAARWADGGDGEFTKTANARITVFHNGVLIHDDVELTRQTGLGLPEGPDPQPILFQDHGNPVRFRNVWVRPID